MFETLDIVPVEVTREKVVLEMPVGPKVHQPMGLLHGGASAVLAESAASMGAWINCDMETEFVVGTDLNISHLRGRSEGVVRAIATPQRVGRAMQVWSIDIVDGDGALVAVSRCTLAVRKIGPNP
jgi:uncharacterized protein (TIGR00369 family)